jgi:hypothetical protein
MMSDLALQNYTFLASGVGRVKKIKIKIETFQIKKSVLFGN